MVYFVSGALEADLLIIALANLLAETSSLAERDKIAKMLQRALTCREKQINKRKATRKARD